jgi:putative FmdB family regulatory protein
MPTYEFKCPNGHVFEKFSPTMNSDRRVKCPVCGKMAERQISGGTGLVFKGSGFYITDYQRKGSTSSLPDHSESEKKKDKDDKADKTDTSSKTPKTKPEKKD